MAKVSPLFALEASELFENGNSQDAIQLCIDGINVFPEYLTGYITLIDILIKSNEIHQAKNYIQTALEKFPDNKQILNFKDILLQQEMYLNQELIDTEDHSSTSNTDLIDNFIATTEETAINDNIHLSQEISDITELNKINAILENEQENDYQQSDESQSIEEFQQKVELINEINVLQTQVLPSKDYLEKTNDVSSLPKGFLSYFTNNLIPQNYSPSPKATDKSAIIGLFEYRFLDFSPKSEINFKIEAAYDINSIISKYKSDQNKKDELQELAKKLEKVQKIEIDDFDEDPIEEVDYTPPATETMAKILIQQGQFEKARQIYLSLAENNPHQQEFFLQKASELEQKINEQQQF